jgi:hexosaminidase
MNKLSLLLYIVITISLLSCKQKQFEADKLAVRWKLIENNVNGESKFKAAFVLVNNSEEPVPDTGWKIFFNVVPVVDSSSVTGNCVIKHVNGDLYTLEPAIGFTLEGRDSLTIEYSSSDWSINYSDAPSGLYIVEYRKDGNEKKPVIIKEYTLEAFTSEKQTSRSKDDVMPIASAEELYKRYPTFDTSVLEKKHLLPIIPRPVSVSLKAETIPLKKLFVVAPDGLRNEKQFLKQNLPESKSVDSIRVALSVNDDKQFAGRPGAYRLTVNNNEIKIVGKDADGVFNGIQSLRQLLFLSQQTDSTGIPQLDIVDYPSFEYRGVHLDVARNFQSKETVKKLLDLMAFYKLNKFHFHLSDDEGWRIEIKGLPELTTFGSKRYHDPAGKALPPSFGSGPFTDNPSGSGYYTREDFIEILRYAKARHIQVIPKVDMPGHARAAVKSMDYRYEQLMAEGKTEDASKYLLRDLNDKSTYRSVQRWNDNVMSICQESTYNFIDAVVSDLQAMYKEADASLETFHIGADEVPDGVWGKSPACDKLISEQELSRDDLQQYFFARIGKLLSEKGISMGGWEEIALRKSKNGNETTFEANPKFINAGFRPYVWNSVWGWGQEDVGYKLANAGYKVVLGNVTNLYFDLAYEKHPEEPGYYWGGFVDTQTVFAFNPCNLFTNAELDKFGRPLDRSKWKSKVMLDEKAKKNILGIQGQLWAENLKGEDRLMYMAFPKMFALAERAWNPEPAWARNSYDKISFEKDWQNFATIIGRYHLPYLDQKSIEYRISPPGATVDNGKLLVKTEYPTQTVRYTTDGTEPQITSEVYHGPVNVTGAVKLKSFNQTDRSSRIVSVRSSRPE